MKRNAKLKTPWNRQGLLHHPVVGGREVVEEWRDNPVFAAEMTYKGTERGRSAAYFKWEDRRGQQYPMFITDIGRMIQAAVKLEEGGKVYGEWFVVKRGQNYGITPALPGDDTHERAQDGPTEALAHPARP